MSSTRLSAEPSSSSERWAGTADQWAGKVHHAELPSGMRVVFRLPSLGEMSALGELPSELIELAIREWARPGASAEMAAAPFEALPEKPTKKEQQQAEAESKVIAERIALLNRHVIAAALIDPHMTPAELDRVPYTDLEKLARMINRADAFDAAGRRIGPEPISTFRAFAEEHGCAPDCPTCESARGKVSTVQ